MPWVWNVLKLNVILPLLKVFLVGEKEDTGYCDLMDRGIFSSAGSSSFNRADIKICNDDSLFKWDPELHIHCLSLGEIALKVEYW